MKKSFFILLLLLTSFSQHAFSQGCSDAGICSAGFLYPGEQKEKMKNSLKVNFGLGMGVDNTLIFSPSLETNLELSESNSLQIKVPYVVVSGDLGNTNGLGDIITTITQHLYNKKDLAFDLSLGFRIPVNNADKSTNKGGVDLGYPMVYQTSLGTFDLLTGISLQYKKWHLAMGYQHPLYQENKNNYIESQWATDFGSKKLEPYSKSRKLKRKPDIMFRGERIFNLSKKSVLTAGVLQIIHLGRDTYETELGGRQEVIGSLGATLNLTASYTYKLNDKFDINVSAGAPIVVRKLVPDGLKRSFVINPSLVYKF